MNVTAELIRQVDKQIQQLQHLKEVLHHNTNLLNQQISDEHHSSAGFIIGPPSLYIHHPKEAKALARAFGGDWERRRDSDSFTFEGKCDGFNVTLFNAEPLPQAEKITL